jgi:hypothetical protein
MKWLKISGGAILSFLLLVYGPFMNYVPTYHIGLAWDMYGGTVYLQDQPGWYFTSPLTTTATLDTRPQKVCLTTAAHAPFNCKLVEFDPRHYQEFVDTEGFGWYWWYNRFSFNSGYREEYRGFRDVVRGYAFSAKKYKFIKVLKDFDEDMAPP